MNLRNFAIWGVIILGILAVYGAMSQGGGLTGAAGAKAGTANGRPEPISYSQLLNAVEAAQIQSVQVRGETLTGDQWLKRIEGAHGRNDTAARAIATLMM